ncbi:unnamed protein product, partial [Ectocarpus sp. 13 AM-2016]
RAHPTPSWSHRSFESSRGASRQRDPVEHRFGHMRQGLGSHRNPTATQAKGRAARGDLNRSLHGGSRANHNRTSRKGN